MQNFEFNLCAVLGHSILYFQKQSINEPLGKAFFLNGGDPAAPSVQETTGEQMQALINHLPTMTRVVGENILPFEQARVSAAQTIAPQEAALQTAIYRQYGPILNQIGNQIAAQNQLAAVSSDSAALNAANQSGLISNALALQRQANPEYYAGRTAIGNANTNFVNNLGDGSLTPTQTEEAIRAINRSSVAGGLANSGSPTAALKSAMNFGDRMQQNRSLVSQALSNAASVNSALKDSFDPFLVATGRTSQNTGDQRLSGPNTNLGQTTANTANNMFADFGQTARQRNEINSKRRDSLDRTLQTIQGVSQAVGNIAGGIAMSDRRLKTSIKFLGIASNGLNVYQFRYKNSSNLHIGYMADEVEKLYPEAVLTNSDGYKMVNYSLL